MIPGSEEQVDMDSTIFLMKELDTNCVSDLQRNHLKTEPTLRDVRALTRTRSDSNSVIIDDAEFEEDVLHLLQDNEHALELFDSIYSDYTCVFTLVWIAYPSKPSTSSWNPCASCRGHVKSWRL